MPAAPCCCRAPGSRWTIIDELTGLFKRRAFDEALLREAERAARLGGDIALVMIDLDSFKSVNDTHGHAQGDLVLREVARVLREGSREVDYPARYGGEELAVILPGTDLKGAFNCAERAFASRSNSCGYRASMARVHCA